MEALKCPSPAEHDGEENAAYKSIVGTLFVCTGPGRCADPLICAPTLFPAPGAARHPLVFCFRQQWKARRAELEVLAVRAVTATDAAKRIPVLLDTTLLRAWPPPQLAAADATPAASNEAHPALVDEFDIRLVLTQLWTAKTGRALPPWSGQVCALLGLPALHHEHQLELGEFCAYHLRDVVFNLDMLARRGRAR